MTQDRLRAPFRTSQLEENAGADGHNPTDNPTMGEIISRRFSRRGLLQGSLAVSAIAATVSPIALITADNARAADRPPPSPSTRSRPASTRPITWPPATTPTCCCAGAIRSLPTRRPSTRTAQTAEAQAQQFGYNNDYRRLHPARRLAPSTACSSSTTNTPTRS